MCKRSRIHAFNFLDLSSWYRTVQYYNGRTGWFGQNRIVLHCTVGLDGSSTVEPDCTTMVGLDGTGGTGLYRTVLWDLMVLVQ
jgi:hypothetical protein